MPFVKWKVFYGFLRKKARKNGDKFLFRCPFLVTGDKKRTKRNAV